MRRGAARAALALLISLGGAGSAAPREETITQFDIDDIALPDGVGEVEPFRSWMKTLGEQPGRRAAAAVAATLAPGTGLSTAQMRELVELWRSASAVSSGLEDPPGKRDERQARFVALLAATGRAPLVLQAAAAAEGDTLECRAEAFAAYLAGTADPESEGWMLARTADCPAWFKAYIGAAPAKAALPALMLADAGEMRGAFGLALFAALASEQGLARFHADDMDSLRGRIGALYLEALLGAGLFEDAVAYHGSMPAAARARAFERRREPLEVRADGLVGRLDGGDLQGDLATDMIAAYALAGRTAEAGRMFAEAKGPERVLARRACDDPSIVAASSPKCENDRRDDGSHSVLLFLDHILNAPDSDPYPLAEGLAGGYPSGNAGLMAGLRCLVFREAAYAALCEEGRKYAVYEEREDDPANRAAAAGALPALGATADSIAKFERRTRAASPPATASPSDRQGRRASIDPLPSPFEERPLPPGLAGSGKPAPKGLAPLPDGFALIRAEVAGSRAVAISASQNYDPAGEVSMGGYWVHLSDDGGQSWEPPLYTGLADRFPYVVLPRSPLPLIDGDSINLAVEINLLDTATISYPPVGLRSRAKRSGLYLRIPIEALRKDGDQDGLSDIAARHLLLDPESMASGTPARLDGHGEACTRDEMAAQEPLRLLLEKAFGNDSGAVMEPLDPMPGLIATGKRVDVVSVDRPMLIVGDPADFRCLRSRRLAVVYSEADVERLRRMSPDFHAVKIGKILFNRARDRGYASWSAGWTGGTVRFRRTARGWTSETISGWIT